MPLTRLRTISTHALRFIIEMVYQLNSLILYRRKSAVRRTSHAALQLLKYHSALHLLFHDDTAAYVDRKELLSLGTTQLCHTFNESDVLSKIDLATLLCFDQC